MFKIEIILVIGIVILLVNHSPIYGQKTYTLTKENPWENLSLSGISNDGQWIHYKMFDSTGKKKWDVIKNLITNEIIEFEKLTWGKFSEKGNWFSGRLGSSLMVMDLTDKSRDKIKNVKRYYFSPSSNYLIAQSNSDSLEFKNLETKKSYQPGKSTIFLVNPVSDIVAMAIHQKNQKQSLWLYNLKTSKSVEIIKNKKVEYKNLAWSSSGKILGVLYFSPQTKTYHIAQYDLEKNEINYLTPDLFKTQTEGLTITEGKLYLSDSGDKMFFYAKSIDAICKENNQVEIWRTDAPLIYTERKKTQSNKSGPWLIVWHTKNGTVLPITTTKTPEVIFNPNSDYALVFDITASKPQFYHYPFVSIYARNTKTGNKELVVEDQNIGINHIEYSPKGKYFVYFKGKNWWIYDVSQKTHIGLTKNIDVPFYQEEQDGDKNPFPYGLMGWTKNEDYVFVYDKYDVWKLETNGGKKERITKGRKKNTVFRIVTKKEDKKVKFDYPGIATYRLNTDNRLLFKATNKTNFSSGFYQSKDEGNLQKIVFKNKRLTNLLQINDDDFVFEEESFSQPPSIVYKHATELKKVVQSNPTWNQYKWPERKLIIYNTQIADSLKGLLIYPVNYDPSKKYPMLVHIYEGQSYYFNQFILPSLFNYTGYNPINYALDDYFVLLPDIRYKKGEPGISATICVKAAVAEALETASINKAKIGLMGHSFGGYETAFIITQTNIFAAAAAGAGISNLISNYFDIYKMTGKSEITRTENGIFRMQESYFENPKAYFRNSPIHHATQINTPLLIWTGKKDRNVNPNQSIQLYLALRRLHKPGKMYLYKNEGHVVKSKENRFDLTQRLKTWFDYYLK